MAQDEDRAGDDAQDPLAELAGENEDTSESSEQFAGRRVVAFDPEEGLSEAAAGVAYRIEGEPDRDPVGERLAALLADPRVGTLQALVVGNWSRDYDASQGSDAVIEGLVAAIDRLPALRAIYLGDITQEESEISWIGVDDWAPLLGFPHLEHLRVRLGSGPVGPLRSETLRSLALQSGGLPGAVVAQVGRAHLPALEHLELWLGTEEYGGIADVAALAPILSGKLFPKLRYLGLRNSAIADQVAAAVASSPLLERLEVLDLSLGTLGDPGGEALLASPAVARLRRLDLHYNFLGEEVAGRLEQLGPEVDVRSLDAEAETWDGEEHRYVSIAE